MGNKKKTLNIPSGIVPYFLEANIPVGVDTGMVLDGCVMNVFYDPMTGLGWFRLPKSKDNLYSFLPEDLKLVGIMTANQAEYHDKVIQSEIDAKN